MSDRLCEEGPEVRFRPSYSATSLNCPGSLLPSFSSPDVAGYEAAVGTLFHRLIAEWQLAEACPLHLLGQTFTIDGHEVTVDHEMFVYGEECLSRYDSISGERYTEVQVDISSLTPIPNQTGTADLVIVRAGVLDVIDWKYGKGIQVFAKHNTQLLCYAWGAFERFDLTHDIQIIRLHIAQPRLSHYDMWEISREELYEFAAWAQRQWALAWRDDASRSPSAKACQWCRVRLRCPARQAALERIVDETFGPVDEIEVTSEEQRALGDPDIAVSPPLELSTERLAWIYRYRRSIEVWFREIGEELIRRGLAGDDLPGWKVVDGRRGNREWRDPDRAAASLERLGLSADELWKRELTSPAQVEKLLAGIGVKGKLSRDYLSLYTDRSAGKPALVPVEDGRMDLAEMVEETFNAEQVDV